MFTGIIEDIGQITGINKIGGKWVFSIRTRLAGGIQEGDSICVDGVCLTATGVSGDYFTADASLETLRITTLNEKTQGSKVNIERAMGSNGRFGGHFVTGHIDGVGIIKEKRSSGESLRLSIEVPKEIARYIVKKGSVAIDGISLTVNSRDDNIFAVNIIPYTADKTTIGEKDIRDKVNIETDIIGKYIESFFTDTGKKEIDRDFLYRHGYIKGE